RRWARSGVRFRRDYPARLGLDHRPLRVLQPGRYAPVASLDGIKARLTEHPFSAVRFHYRRLVSPGIGSPVSLPRYSAAEPEHDDERAGQQSAPEVRARCEPAHAVPTG